MGEDLLNVSVVDYSDAVGNIHDFIQFKGDEQDSYTLISLTDQHLMYVFDSTDIQAAGGLDRDQKLGLLGNLPSDDDLLLVAARESACGLGTAVLGADIVGFDQFLGEGTHFFAVDPASGREFIGAVFFHNGIFIYGKAQHQAVLMAVCRNGRHSVVNAVLGISVLDLFAVEDDPAPALLEVVDRFHKFMLAVAVDTGNTDDLAGTDLQVKILDRINSLFVFHIEILDIQHYLFGFCRCLVDHQLDGVSDHHGRKFILGYTLYRDCINILTAADDRAHIRRCLDLFELVCDDDDRLAVFDQIFHDRKKLINLLLGQDCCRLVKDQDLGSAVQSLEDFDTLLHTDGNIPYALVRIDIESVFFDNIQDILSGLSHVQADGAYGRLGAQDDILSNCEILHQHKVLVYHADAVFNGSGRAFNIDLLSVDENLTLIRMIEAVEDIHQRAFAGAVLTKDRVDRSTFHVEIDIGQRIEGTKPLGDSMHLHSIFAADFWCHIYLPLFQRFLVGLKFLFGRRRDNRAALDLLTDLDGRVVDFIGIILVVLGDADSVVSEAEAHVLSSDLPSCDVLSGDNVYRNIDILERGCQYVIGSQICLVTVDADRILTCLFGRFDDAGACSSGRMINNVTAICEHLVGDTLALGGIGETLRILGSDGDVLSEHSVGIGNTCFIAVLELVNDFTGNTADKTDLLCLGNRGRYVADHEGRLLCTEYNAGHIRKRFPEGIIHTGKVDIRIGLGRLDNCIRAGKADTPAERIAVIDQCFKVSREIAALFRLDIIDFRSGLLAQPLQSLPCALVKGLVVDAAGIGDHRNLVPGSVNIRKIIGFPEKFLDRSLIEEDLEFLQLIFVCGRYQDTCLDLLSALECRFIDSIRIIAVVFGNADSIVGESEGKCLAADLHACDMHLGDSVDCDIDIFQGGGQHIFGSKICLVAVDADRIFARFFCRLNNTGSCSACRVINDIAAVCEHLVGNTLALGRVREALCVLGGNDDILVQYTVGIGDTCLIAVFKLVNNLAGNASDEADLAGLSDRRRYISDHEG